MRDTTPSEAHKGDDPERFGRQWSNIIMDKAVA